MVWGPAWIKIHINSIWLRARSNMASHYAWGTNTVCEMQDGYRVYMDGFLCGIEWVMFCARLDCFQKPPLEVGLTRNREAVALQTLTSVDLFYFIMVWEPTWIEIHWDSIWLRAQSRMASYYTWGSVTTLHDFGGLLGRAWDTFFWALTISWSRLLARVWEAAFSVANSTCLAHCEL